MTAQKPLYSITDAYQAGYQAGWNYEQTVTRHEQAPQGPHPLPSANPCRSEHMADAWQRGFDAGEQASYDRG